MISEETRQNKMPTVSVVMPCFNRVSYLAESVDSILNQTYKDLELILVDDGSTDDSNILFDYYQKKDPRVKVIHQNNQGISGARNAGIKEARGEYIVVADSDDISNPNRLKWSIKAIQDHDFVYGTYGLGDSRAVALGWYKPHRKITLKHIRNNDSWPHLTIMGKKECFEGAYRNDFKVNDDAWLMWEWFKRGYKGRMINKPLAIQRGHAGNTTQLKKKEIAKTQEIMDREYDKWELCNSRLKQSQK